MTDETTEKLRDAVIEAAETVLANPQWMAAAREMLMPLRDAKQALDDHLKPDPLREAVALLRRALKWGVAAPAYAEIDAFLAEHDKDGAS